MNFFERIAPLILPAVFIVAIGDTHARVRGDGINRGMTGTNRVSIGIFAALFFVPADLRLGWHR